MDVSDPAARDQSRDMITDNRNNPDEVRQGPSNPKGGDGSDYYFFRQGSDVVVTDGNGNFVTILKGGDTNGWFQRATKKMMPGRMNLVGRKVTGIRRVEYFLPGGTRRPHGPLELALDGGERVAFDAGPDGESLRSSTGGWRDPFGDPQPPENEVYLARAGRWVAPDVSAEPPYDAMVGALISDTNEITSAAGKLAGLVIITPAVGVRLEVQADELVVTWERRSGDD